MMDRKQIDTTIINYLEPFKPERIGIFGSYAREEQTEDSDLDILVSFKETISLFDLVQIHQELSDLLGIKVDVVTEGALKNETLKKYIYQDLQMILNEE
jgi:predicted nucleotidyltransferase